MIEETEGGREAREACEGLQMPPEQMLDLARKAAELVVERIDGLPRENAWEGEFRRELENWLLEEPPEAGRPAAEVIEQAARDILPIATRLDHPRCFGFVPTAPTWPGVLADFMAAGYNANALHLAGRQRPEPTGTGSHRLVAALARLPRERWRAVDERRFGGQPRRLGRGAGSSGPPRADDCVHERPEP